MPFEHDITAEDWIGESLSYQHGILEGLTSEMRRRALAETYNDVEDVKTYDPDIYRDIVFGNLLKRFHIHTELYKVVNSVQGGKSKSGLAKMDKKRSFISDNTLYGLARKGIDFRYRNYVGRFAKQLRIGSESSQYVLLYSPEQGYEHSFDTNLAELEELNITHRLFQEFNRLIGSYEDHLTGCKTRGFLAGHIKQYFPEKQDTPPRDDSKRFAVLLLDVDEFKQINDRNGMDTGDKVLATIGQTLLSICRAENDVVARIGGDEFIILVGVESDPLQKVLPMIHERITQSIQHLNIDGVTPKVSIGTWEWETGITFEKAKIQAEKDLRKNKSNDGKVYRLAENLERVLNTSDNDDQRRIDAQHFIDNLSTKNRAALLAVLSEK